MLELIEQMMDELEQLTTGTYVKADTLAQLIERYRELTRQEREEGLW